VQISNKYGRMIGMGQDGTKFKLVLHIKGVDCQKWMAVALELIEAIYQAKVETKKNIVS